MRIRLIPRALPLVLLAGAAHGQGCPCTNARYCVSSFQQLRSALTTQPLQPGDVICVQPPASGPVYTVTQAISITAQGAPGNPIVIRGVRDAAGNRPVLEALPQATRTGILEFSASARWWVVEGLELRGATHSGVNSWEGPAGIHIAGQDIIVRDCDTHSNGLGFYSLRSARNLLFENCEIHGNRRHNFSSLAESITLRGCHLYDCAPGSVNYKERCRVSLLEGNLIEGPGAGSYDVDFAGSWSSSATTAPVDSHALMLGNIILHDSAGATPTIINLGDGSPTPGMHLRRGSVDLINNTIVATNSNPAVFRRFWDPSGTASATAILRLHNNIVHNLNPFNDGNKIFRAGGGTHPENLAAWTAYPSVGSNNWVSQLGNFDVQNYAPNLASSTTYGFDPGFESAVLPFDFSLAPGAACRDIGDPAPLRTDPSSQPGMTLLRESIPLLQFVQQTSAAGVELRRFEASIDIGAFEGSSRVAAPADLTLGGSFSAGASAAMLAGPLRLGMHLPGGALYALLAAPGLGPPISIPPIQGFLKLDLGGAFLSVLAQGSGSPSGVDLLQIPIPNDPTLVGGQVAFQTFNCDLLGSGLCTWSRDTPLLTIR